MEDELVKAIKRTRTQINRIDNNYIPSKLDLFYVEDIKSIVNELEKMMKEKENGR